MPTETPSSRESLLEQHAAIDHALEDLVTAYETGDHGVAREAFRELDRLLAAHLAFEEQRLLPAFAAVDAEEARQISDEHRAIRAAVDELGVGADLHLTRLPAIRKLADRLRTHARREDSLFYRWVEEQAQRRPEDHPQASPRI